MGGARQVTPQISQSRSDAQHYFCACVLDLAERTHAHTCPHTSTQWPDLRNVNAFTHFTHTHTHMYTHTNLRVVASTHLCFQKHAHLNRSRGEVPKPSPSPAWFDPETGTLTPASIFVNRRIPGGAGANPLPWIHPRSPAARIERAQRRRCAASVCAPGDLPVQPGQLGPGSHCGRASLHRGRHMLCYCTGGVMRCVTAQGASCAALLHRGRHALRYCTEVCTRYITAQGAS